MATALAAEARDAAQLNREWQQLLAKHARERGDLFARVESKAKSLEAAIERAADYVEGVTSDFPDDLTARQDALYTDWTNWSAPEISTDDESDDEPLSVYEAGDIDELVKLVRTADAVG